MPSVRDAYEHAKWLIDKGRADEPAVLYLPRAEAQRRKENKEKSCRVVFVCTPETKSEFETQRDRYITICINKEIAFTVMCEVLATPSDEAIRERAEQ
jgi:hypothetical protein